MRSPNRAVIGISALLLAFLLLIGAQSHSPISSDIVYDQIPLHADIVVSVNTTWLEGSADWITADITGVTDPQQDDWIGIFTAPIDLKPGLRSAPIKYKFANASEPYLSEGRGSTQFYIVNPRSDVVVAFVRGGLAPENATVVAVSPPVRFRHPSEPQFPRWSIGQAPSTYRLSWVGGQYDAEPSVQWGTSPDRLDRVARAERHRFGREQMCGPPASDVGWYDPGFTYQALIEHVAPGAVVHYRFGSSKVGFSDVMQFRAPPAAAQQPVRFYVYGDMGSGQIDGSQNAFITEQDSLATTALMASANFTADFVLHVGDISYADGYLAQWDYFLWQIAPIASAIPYQTAIGNHEREYPGSGGLFNGTDSGGECGVPYAHYFPTPQGVSVSEPWYSFDAGSVHIVVMSSEDDFSPGSSQFEFLKRDLGSVNREKTPWVIVVGHRPMYCDSIWQVGHNSDGEVAKLLRAELEQLLYDADVDLAIWGHNHSYQRTCPVLNENCMVGKAPIHVVVGTAGFYLSRDGHPSPPTWLKRRLDSFGIGRITATSSELRFEFVLSNNGTVADSVVLNRLNVAFM